MGLATTKLLASKGAIISLADLNETAVKAATKDLPVDRVEHMYTVVDVSNPQSVDEWIKATKSKYGRIDGAVNMAGIIKTARPITEMEDSDLGTRLP